MYEKSRNCTTHGVTCDLTPALPSAIEGSCVEVSEGRVEGAGEELGRGRDGDGDGTLCGRLGTSSAPLLGEDGKAVVVPGQVAFSSSRRRQDPVLSAHVPYSEHGSSFGCPLTPAARLQACGLGMCEHLPSFAELVGSLIDMQRAEIGKPVVALQKKRCWRLALLEEFRGGV